ncbi:pilus assembly protein PilZ [Pseudomonas sp. 250J]|uniref:Flagellar brake protein n=1 Tax=Pseudomonas peradeniyensis TaxID=2745488 RepID=A0ABT2VDA7_9PSED|nr:MULTISPECIES: flagellar brake protein [unclassified Pseudomonas]KNX76730.1 pilus assembly protein PilZ [Pseudomonas sp. 250J]MCU7239278.1 flagellar brake protein [Pseudomonas peradeniyensis]MCU7281577.1 flagellar brake protein [Pseudomonas peradeniyensis]QZA55865.1 flagellar brake protein [Pseudomonas sp. 2hn]
MFNESDAPQPPKVLSTPLEITANLRQLLESHDPLIISFHERSQRFQSYVVHVDRDSGVLALDEMIPRDGEKYIENGEPFRVEGFHDGVRIAWESNTALTISEIDGNRCYRGPLPEEVTYHQRRNAFRAALKLSQLVDIVLDGTHLKGNGALRGKLLDISATGCKLRFDGNVEDRLQLGQVYERFKASTPLGLTDTLVELRHLHFEERINTTFAGVRFHNLNGQAQRKIESFVYQLQREARRFDKDDY